MTHDKEPRVGEITFAESLRDKAWEYLPAKSRTAKETVEVTYHPLGTLFIDHLTLELDGPNIVIELSEELKREDVPNDSYRFLHTRVLVVHSDTGKVLSYREYAEVKDEGDDDIDLEDSPSIHMNEFEESAASFDSKKLNFFLEQFDHI